MKTKLIGLGILAAVIIAAVDVYKRQRIGCPMA